MLQKIFTKIRAILPRNIGLLLIAIMSIGCAPDKNVSFGEHPNFSLKPITTPAPYVTGSEGLEYVDVNGDGVDECLKYSNATPTTLSAPSHFIITDWSLTQVFSD